MSLFEKHQSLINQATQALHARTFYAAFVEQPLPAVYGERADEDARNKFAQLLGKKFEELHQADPSHWLGQEESPYTQDQLGILYPAFSVDTLVDRSKKAYHSWRKITPQDRAGILIESLERIKARFFEIAYATMHTTGQGFMMAFQASGPHAADRALEAIVAGYEELTRFPVETVWDKPMGKYNLQLKKEWKAVPKGISVVIGCSTFPTWNSVPGIYASLITGNAVIVKPHPGAILPTAIVVAEIQKVLLESNIDPNVCQLAVDVADKTITKALAEHADVKLIDFTGNSDFGTYLESIKGKAVFTEKTGVNSVIIDSVDDVDKVAANLAFSLSLYSGQMCTAPQNFYIPESGIKSSAGHITVDDFTQKLIGQINALVENPKAGPFVLGAIQNKKTSDRVNDVDKLPGKVLLKSKALENPMFKNARTATPAVLEIEASQKDVFSKELFGPIALIIKTKNTDQSISLAKEMAEKHGAISCGAYTTDATVKEKIADEMAQVATPVSFNLVGGIYLNQHAAFSDFHVTGGNPAGNASFTNPDFVTRRFTWVGQRELV